MAKIEKILEQCCALFNTSTGVFDLKYTEVVYADKSVEYIDLINKDANGEALELTVADITPTADQIVVSCDHKITTSLLCERFLDADGNVDHTVKFERCTYTLTDKLGNKIYPNTIFDYFVEAVDGTGTYGGGLVAGDLYTVTDTTKVGSCDLEDKEVVQPFTMEATSDGTDTVTVPAGATQITIHSTYQDDKEGSAGYTINGQAVTDLCACEDKTYRAWEWQCFGEVTIVTAPENVATSGESRTCVDYVA